MLYKNCLHVKAKAKKDGETGGRYFAAHAVVQTQQTESCTVARNGCCNYYYLLSVTLLCLLSLPRLLAAKNI